MVFLMIILSRPLNREKRQKKKRKKTCNRNTQVLMFSFMIVSLFSSAGVDLVFFFF